MTLLELATVAERFRYTNGVELMAFCKILGISPTTYSKFRKEVLTGKPKCLSSTVGSIVKGLKSQGVEIPDLQLD